MINKYFDSKIWNNITKKNPIKKLTLLLAISILR